jgi:hypothetical protein
MKKIPLILVFILCSAIFSYADEYEHSITLGIYTWHYAKGDYTEGVANRLIALEYKNWYVADFNNSHGRETQFLGYGWHTKKFKAEENENFWVRGNLYTGILIGYGKNHPVHWGAISPGVYPTGSIGYDRYSLEVGVMPGFVWSGIKIEF